MKKSNILLLISGILLLGFLVFWATTSIFIPANVSYNLACASQEEIDILLESYVIEGSVETKEDEIIVTIFVEDEDVIKHEWIHVKQLESDRIYSCSHKILRTMNEIEAYFMEDVPNPIYNLIYGEPEI